MSVEISDILKIVEIVQKPIYIMLLIIVGLGIISFITNIIRLAITRVVFSMILVVSAMIINIASKFLALDLIIYTIGINNLILSIGLLLMQIIITIILIVIIFKKKKRL